MLSASLLVADVEPLVPPPLDGHRQLDVEVCGGWIDVDSAATYIVDYRARRRLALQLEETLEETKVWLDSEPALAKSNDAGDVENRIWGQLMQLEPIEAKDAGAEKDRE